jgi:hypothetical protein
MMAKADVLQFIDDVSQGQAEATLVDRYYDEVIEDLCRLSEGFLSNVDLVAVTKGTSIYSYPSNTVDLLGVFWDDAVLRRAAQLELESLDPHWRDHNGDPLVFTDEDLSAKSLRLYPAPQRGSKPFSFPTGLPMGTDYPEYSLAVARTRTVDDLPAWLEWPVAFEVLFREFMRESNHRDPDFAALCRQLALVLLKMVAQ